MIFILFVIISITFFLEAISLVGRLAGIYCKNIYSGFSANGLFAIISRFLMFFYSPVFGYLSDTNNIIIKNNEIFFIIIILVLPLSILVIKFKFFFNILINFVNHVSLKGRLFGFNSISILYKNRIEAGNFKLKISPTLIISYLFFYISLPITFILISKFNEFRATLISLTTILTGFNTLYLTLYLDPKLSTYNLYSIKVYSIYFSLTINKLIALIISGFIFVIIHQINGV